MGFIHTRATNMESMDWENRRSTMNTGTIIMLSSLGLFISFFILLILFAHKPLIFPVSYFHLGFVFSVSFLWGYPFETITIIYLASLLTIVFVANYVRPTAIIIGNTPKEIKEFLSSFLDAQGIRDFQIVTRNPRFNFNSQPKIVVQNYFGFISLSVKSKHKRRIQDSILQELSINGMPINRYSRNQVLVSTLSLALLFTSITIIVALV